MKRFRVWVCPVCDATPYDDEEDTCSNPYCEKHWTRLLDEPMRSRQRQACIDNELRRPR